MAFQCQLMRAADAHDARTYDRNFQTWLPENCIVQASGARASAHRTLGKV